MQIQFQRIIEAKLNRKAVCREVQFDVRRILIARAISKLCLLQQNFILQQKTNLPHPCGWGHDFLQSRKSLKKSIINQRSL